MRAVLMLAVVTAALAGCFGGDDDAPAGSGPDSNSTAPPNGNGTVPPSNNTTPPPDNNTTQPPGDNTTGNGSANNTTGNASANMTWSYDNRSGEVSGMELLITGPSAEEESVTIDNGTLILFFNITVEGDELEVWVTPPGCDDESCQSQVDVQSGSGSFRESQPAEGEWTVTFDPQTSIGSSFAASYELAIAVAAPAESEADGEADDEGE